MFLRYKRILQQMRQGTFRFSTEQIAGKTAVKVKVFVWNNAFQPVSKVKD